MDSYVLERPEVLCPRDLLCQLADSRNQRHCEEREFQRSKPYSTPVIASEAGLSHSRASSLLAHPCAQRHKYVHVQKAAPTISRPSRSPPCPRRSRGSARKGAHRPILCRARYRIRARPLPRCTRNRKSDTCRPSYLNSLHQGPMPIQRVFGR